MKEEIREKCEELFQSMKYSLEKIDLKQGVMDVIVNLNPANKSELQAKMVEINVFDRDARASLYNWEED